MRLRLVLLLAPFVLAQDDGCADECGETEISISGAGADGDRIDIVVDPFRVELPVLDEPNRPEPVRVGTWDPPALDTPDRRELERLVAARGVRPDDAGLRYRLAEFYLDKWWFPHAEAEFQRAAALEPESIRPWEGLLRVYRSGEFDDGEPEAQVFFFLPRPPEEKKKVLRDWLPSTLARQRRISGAYRGILKRRPGDIERRRAYIAHLKAMGDFDALVAECRAVLQRMPGDAGSRYELAEALRRLGDNRKPEKQGHGTEEWTEALRLLEENLKHDPDHVPTLLRVIRMLYVEHGNKIQDRLAALEERAFFLRYARQGIAPLAFRADVRRMARTVAGRSVANSMWDAAMRPPGTEASPDDIYFERWIYLQFPGGAVNERIETIRTLGRRGGESAVGVFVAFLWHLDDPEEQHPEAFHIRAQGSALERAALQAAAALGPPCYPAAGRFLRAADTNGRRRRAVALLRALRDKRATEPLIEALAWDNEEQRAFGVAAALEEIGDPRAVDALVDAALDVRHPAARRREAAEALGAFKDPRCVEAITRLAADPDYRLVTGYTLFRLTGDEEALRKMAAVLVNEGRVDEVLRLVAKCDDPRIEKLLMIALDLGERDLRPEIIRLLKERFWKTAKPRVLRYFLDESKTSAITAYAIRMLGEIGGDEAVKRLFEIVRDKKHELWTDAARAFAQTGDPSAVQYFNRMRILERDEDRRALAQELHKVASVRQVLKSRPQ